jgi:hypothetical protein
MAISIVPRNTCVQFRKAGLGMFCIVIPCLSDQRLGVSVARHRSASVWLVGESCGEGRFGPSRVELL